MSEEEKEAIEILKNQIADYVIGDYCRDDCLREDLCKEDDCPYEKAIDIVLNLIEKQQKEIEEVHKAFNKKVELIVKNNKIVDTEFISKDKIRDKIKGLEKAILSLTDDEWGYGRMELEERIRMLQKLLGEENE